FHFQRNKLNMLSFLMNKGDINVITFHRALQVGGDNFTADYLFLGPSAVYRQSEVQLTNIYPSQNLIYVSLGTIFNTNEHFFHTLIEQFRHSKYTLLIANSAKESLSVFTN